jgi:hypothetical protein
MTLRKRPKTQRLKPNGAAVPAVLQPVTRPLFALAVGHRHQTRRAPLFALSTRQVR